MDSNEIRFIRLTNGSDLVAEVVKETKSSITLKSAMTMITEVDIEGGRQMLVLYPWFPHGVLLDNLTILKKRDIMLISDIEDDTKDYYINNCLELFGDNQKLVGAKIANPTSNTSDSLVSGSNILMFDVTNRIKKNTGTSSN